MGNLGTCEIAVEFSGPILGHTSSNPRTVPNDLHGVASSSIHSERILPACNEC